MAVGGLTTAQVERKNAAEERYLKARRSFRVWPILVGQTDNAEVCIRRFFILNMKVPAALAKDVEIESIKKAINNHPRSKIHDEYIVTFTEREGRDAVKAYANGLATCAGAAGLRLELPDSLKGSYRVLEEHGYAIKQLYGKETKRNVKFDDRTLDLMMDIKLPGSTTWHDITTEQARRAKKHKDEMEIGKLAQGKTIAGPALDRERAKVLMLTYSPHKATGFSTLATGANLIDIEDGFSTNCGGDNEADESAAAEDDQSGCESDESMSHLLHGERPGGMYR